MSSFDRKGPKGLGPLARKKDYLAIVMLKEGVSIVSRVDDPLAQALRRER